MAEAIAATEDAFADTLDRMAWVEPHDAARLRAKAAPARSYAARERRHAAYYSQPSPGSDWPA